MKYLNKKIVYKGKAFSVEEYTIPKTGSRFARTLESDSVGILPILKNGKILLERQYRHALERYLYEMPAGTMEKGEDPKATAGRELEEETGYHAGKLTHMFMFYPGPGKHTEVMNVYLAQDLKKTQDKKDLDEIIETMEVSLSEALHMIKTNKIKDSKTMSSILFYMTFIRGKK